MRKSIFWLAACGAWALAAPAMAEGLARGGKPLDRMAIFRNQAKLIDTRLAAQYSYSDRLKPGADQNDKEIPVYSGSYRGEFMALAREAAARHGVPEDLFLRLVQQESGWNPGAVSPKGATGLAQLMPGTAQMLGVDIGDPAQNLDGGARYLRAMYDKFGDWRLALAAYNAGPEAVDRHDGVPPYAETTAYVAAILGTGMPATSRAF